MGHNKGNFILLAHGPAVIAGMSNGVDSNRKPDKYRPLVDILHSSGIFPLNLAFLHILLAGITFHTFDICDFIVKGLDTQSRSVVASRKEAMLKKRQNFYLDRNASGNAKIYEDRIFP